MSGATKRAPGVTVGAVLAYLQREADLDGLVTVSTTEIGDALGVTHSAVSQHLSSLVEQGFIAKSGHSTGVKSHYITAYQLSDEVMA